MGSVPVGMNRITRRKALYGIGTTAAAAALAGCTEEVDPDPGDEDEDEDESSDPAVETVTHQVGQALSGPAWRHESRVGTCLLITDPSAGGWLSAEADEETVAFLEETDFEQSVVAYVESVGPTTCHSLIEFSELAVEDGTLVGNAVVASTADDTDEDVACGEAITYSGAMARVTAESLPEQIRLTVTDGWGESADLTGEEGVRDRDALDGFIRPSADPTNVPSALTCPDDEFERHFSVDGEVNWGSGGSVGDDDGLELRLVNPTYDGDDPDEALTLERGDEFRVEMTNVAARDIGVGNHGKYTLELYTEAGWTEVRGGDDSARFEYTDELVSTRPGETVEWSFTMTEDGLIEGGPHEDHLRVCPDLEPGRYRFTFWGADDLAVAFDYAG